MTLEEWAKKQPVTLQFAEWRFCYFIPDVRNLVDRWQAWRLEDFLVSSVTGGTIWFTPRRTTWQHATSEGGRNEEKSFS